jgi:hypothetical protein
MANPERDSLPLTGNDRNPEGHGFQIDKPKTLGRTGKNEKMGSDHLLYYLPVGEVPPIYDPVFPAILVLKYFFPQRTIPHDNKAEVRKAGKKGLNRRKEF